MSLECINLVLIQKHKDKTKTELIQRVISRDLTSLVIANMNGKAKANQIKTLDVILDEFENPKKIETEEEVIARIERAFKGKIQR